MRNDDPAHAVRPFDRERDGFVVGEGAAIVVLESLEHAQRRGAEIWAELTGYGSAQDAYRITDAHPEGRGAATCMTLALKDADAAPEANQLRERPRHRHACLNDKVETLAIKRVFGDDAYQVPISSTKSMLGHFTTAGGAIELVVSIMAHSQRRSAADDQLRNGRSRLRFGLRSQRRPRATRAATC